MCDICNNESEDSRDVGVAAVPHAPVSVMWCQNCLRENAVPRFVVETWLFSDFYEGFMEMSEEPLPMELDDWAANKMKLWIDDKYITIRDAFPRLWHDAYLEVLADRQASGDSTSAGS